MDKEQGIALQVNEMVGRMYILKENFKIKQLQDHRQNDKNPTPHAPFFGSGSNDGPRVDKSRREFGMA